jgi:hypothetical protein
MMGQRNVDLHFNDLEGHTRQEKKDALPKSLDDLLQTSFKLSSFRLSALLFKALINYVDPMQCF